MLVEVQVLSSAPISISRSENESPLRVIESKSAPYRRARREPSLRAICRTNQIEFRTVRRIGAKMNHRQGDQIQTRAVGARNP